MPDQERPVVVYVEWIDAGTVATRWRSVDEAIDEAKRMATSPILSAGILVEETPGGIVLAVSHNPGAEDVAGAMFIPTSSIRRIERWEPDPEVRS